MTMDCDVAGRGSERDADDAVVVKWFGQESRTLERNRVWLAMATLWSVPRALRMARKVASCGG